MTATGQQQVWNAVSEDDWLRTIIDAARLYGWRVTHFRSALTGRGYRTPVQGDAGFFDLVMAHPIQHRTLFVETKDEKGQLDPEQIIWRDVVLAAGGVALLWRPHDVDLIHEVLAGGSDGINV